MSLYSVADAAARFGVTTQTVRNWIASGRLSALQPTRRGRFRIPADALLNFERDARFRGGSDRLQPQQQPPLDQVSSAADRPHARQPRKVEAELERIVRAIVANVRPETVILFGSRARGDFKPDSDFDLALVTPDGTERRRLAMRAYESIAALPGRSVGVDLVVLTPEIIENERDLVGSITRAVLREGVPVYGSPTVA